MYHLPPNNAIGTITDLNQPDELRKSIVDLDIELQLRSDDNVNAGNGPVKGTEGNTPGATRSR